MPGAGVALAGGAVAAVAGAGISVSTAGGIAAVPGAGIAVTSAGGIAAVPGTGITLASGAITTAAAQPGVTSVGASGARVTLPQTATTAYSLTAASDASSYLVLGGAAPPASGFSNRGILLGDGVTPGSWRIIPYTNGAGFRLGIQVLTAGGVWAEQQAWKSS